MADARDPELARGQFQGPFIGHGTEDEMGMVVGGGEEIAAAGFDGGVNPLDGLLCGREIGPDDHVDVANLPHGFVVLRQSREGFEPSRAGLEPAALPLS